MKLSNFKINQENLLYKFSEDSVKLLSMIKTLPPNAYVADLGAGSGIISIGISKNFIVKTVHSFEIFKDSYESLKSNICLNKCKSIIPLNQNYKALKNKEFINYYNLIISNPPYFKKNEGKLPRSKALQYARHEIAANLKDIINIARKCLKNKGRLIFCYPQNRNSEVLEEVKDKNLFLKKKEILKNKKRNLIFYEFIKLLPKA